MIQRFLPRLPRAPLLLIGLLALASTAHALDAGRVAPALEAAFPGTLSYLDCPFHGSGRTCVLLPGLASATAARQRMRAWARALPGAVGLPSQPGTDALTFTIGSTAYRLALAPSRARPGMLAATLTFGFDRSAARHAICLRTDAMVALASRPSLEPNDYAALATAIACHGPDPADAAGRTPLFRAIDSGNVAAVLALLRGGADPNHIDGRGRTPLLAAARSGTAATLDALIQAGADASYVAPDGSSLQTLEPFNPHLSGRSAVMLTLPAPTVTDLSLAAGPGATFAAAAGEAKPPAPGYGSSPPAAAPESAAAGSPARARRGPAASASVPLELLGLVVVVLLAVLRLRARRAGPAAVHATATRTELPAMPVPHPYLRRPRHRAASDGARGSDPPG